MPCCYTLDRCSTYTKAMDRIDQSVTAPVRREEEKKITVTAGVVCGIDDAPVMTASGPSSLIHVGTKTFSRSHWNYDHDSYIYVAFLLFSSTMSNVKLQRKMARAEERIKESNIPFFFQGSMESELFNLEIFSVFSTMVGPSKIVNLISQKKQVMNQVGEFIDIERYA